MLWLPNTKEVLNAMEKFENYSGKKKMPRLCFETSFLMYNWILINDGENVPRLVAGERYYNNNSDDYCFHVWIIYKNKIIDYTAIQFNEEIRYNKEYMPLENIDKVLDLEKFQYEYEIDDQRYGNYVDVRFLTSIQNALVLNKRIDNLYELAEVYGKKDLEIKKYFEKLNLPSLTAFDLSMQMFFWFEEYDINGDMDRSIISEYYCEQLYRYLRYQNA